MLHVKFTSKPFDKLELQCAVVGVFSSTRPLKGIASLIDWRLNGGLSRVMLKHRFKGELKEALLLPAEGRIRSKEILVLGLGPEALFNETGVGQFIQTLLEKISMKKNTDFLISFGDMVPDRFEWRNNIRLLVSKLHDYPALAAAVLCETEDCIRDAKRRHMDFGLNVNVSFEIL